MSRRKGTQESLARNFESLTPAGREIALLRFRIPDSVIRGRRADESEGEAMARWVASRGNVRAVCNELGC